MLLRVLLNSDDEHFQHPLIHSLLDVSLVLADHTGNVCRADAVVEGIWLIFDDQQNPVSDQESALQTFRASGGAYPGVTEEPLVPLALPLPLLNGSVQFRARLLQPSQFHGGRIFRLRCQVALPSHGGNPPVHITGHSQPFCAARYKLEMLNTFPDVFYKDRGGDSQSLEINGRFTDADGQLVAPSELTSISLQLSVMYENRQRIDTSQKTILAVKTCTVDAAASTFFCNFRLCEVSRHHRGQRFVVCVSTSHGAFAPLLTAAVEVKSKKWNSKKDRQTTINANFHHINTNIHSLNAHFASGDPSLPPSFATVPPSDGETFQQARMKKRQRQPGLGGDVNVARALSILIMGYESLLNTIKRNEWEPVGDDGQYTTFKCKFCGVFCLSLSTPVHRPTCPIWAHMQTHDVAIASVIPLLRAMAVVDEDVIEESVGPLTAPPAPLSSSSTSLSSSSVATSTATALHQSAQLANSSSAPDDFTLPRSTDQKPSSLADFSAFANGNFEAGTFSELPDMDDLGGLFGTSFFNSGLTCGQERALEGHDEGFQFMDQFFSEPQMRSMGGRVSATALAAARSACRSDPSSISNSTATSGSARPNVVSGSSSSSVAAVSSALSTLPASLAAALPLTNPPHNPFSVPPVKELSSRSLKLPNSHPLNPSHPCHRAHVGALPVSSPNSDVWRALEKLKLARQKVQIHVGAIRDDDEESEDEGDEGDDEDEDMENESSCP